MIRALAVLLLLAPALPRAAVDGAEVFRRKCASCHGADGAGGSRKLRDLASAEVQARSDQELFEAVARGTPDRKMAGFRVKLADAEIKAAIAHLRTLKR